MSRRLVILDRDGVINHDSDDFIKSPAEWLPIDGSIEAISRLSAAGFDVAVATNQSGVGRKYIDRPTLEAIHDKMRRAVRDAGGDITRIVYCPHLPDAGCDCRKPKSGLYLQIGTYLGVPLEGVPMIGWFDPGLMDRLKLALVTFLIRSRTYITKIAVSTLSVIETLDVIKDILLGFVSCQVSGAINSLAFQ